MLPPKKPLFSKLRRLLVSFISFLLLTCSATSAQSSLVLARLPFVKENAYAEYNFHSGSISFLNGTFTAFPEDSRAKASFRWECVHAERNVGWLNVTMSFNHESGDAHFSTILEVDTETRTITMLNGTNLGMTFLWVKPDIEENQTVTITNGITGEVYMVSLAESPQGHQESFWVSGTGEVLGCAVTPGGGYDLNTGILIESTFFGEPTLLALGILDPGVVGRVEFAATNIDLGPSSSLEPSSAELMGQRLTFFLVGSLFVAFVGAFIAVVKKRKRRRLRRGDRILARPSPL